jgi:adenylate cyclase
MTSLREGLRRHLRTVIGFAACGSLIGILYVAVNNGLTPDGMARGVLAGALIAGGIFAGEMVLRASRFAAPLRRLPFLAFLIAKSLLWVVWIVATLVAVRLALPIPELKLFADLLGDVAFSLVVSSLLVLAFELDRLLGPGTIWRLLTGRYHTPRIEERAFLLLDVAGSTTIAERIGPERFLALLDFLIGGLTPAFAAHRAEIYRYVGDAIIVTWPIDEAVEQARCVRCLGDVGRRMAELRSECRRRFDCEVDGRAALHAGPVAIGEIGEIKREITMLGETLNTASKLEKIAGELDRRAIISGDLLDRMRLPPMVRVEPLGAVAIPGRSQKMELFALDL